MPILDKFKNDSTKKQLGFAYQYIIALECCLNLKDGFLLIEQQGDVSDLKNQIEVKHHFDENHKLTLKHIDFWKTLKNWVENYKLLQSYEGLILMTTSRVEEGTALDKWNDLTKEDKLRIIESIRNDEKIGTIKEFLEFVFSFNEDYCQNELLSILEKFKIQHSESIIQSKIEELAKKPNFDTIPFKNRKHFIFDLMAYIQSQGIKNPNSWIIDIADFKNHFINRSSHYVNGKIPLPKILKTADLESADNEKKFICELKRIEIEENLIADAIIDYNRANKAIIQLIENDYEFAEAIVNYQEDLFKALNYEKGNCEEDHCRKPEEERKKESRRFYRSCMQWNLKAIEGVLNNEDYFQRGNLHQVIDEGRHIWYIDFKEDKK